MGAKNKLLTVLVILLLLFIFAGFGLFKPGSKASGAKSVIALGGVESRMPVNSAKVFFESTMGRKLSGYSAYKNMDEALFALRSGKVDAIWACDVTAKYLLSKNDDLQVLDNDSMADIQKTEEARFSFGMALKDTEASRELRNEIDLALSDIQNDGTLSGLKEEYIDKAAEPEAGLKENRFYPSKMKSAKNKNSVTVGVTGAVSPVELIDEEGSPYGFCVALMDEIGLRINKKIKFVVLDSETAFTSLMSGRVDLLFAYGTGMKTTETKEGHIMTEGYLPMQRYEFIERINK